MNLVSRYKTSESQKIIRAMSIYINDPWYWHHMQEIGDRHEHNVAYSINIYGKNICASCGGIMKPKPPDEHYECNKCGALWVYD